MERISDEKLDALLAEGCKREDFSKDGHILTMMLLQELKERRVADKLLDIKGQLRLVRDRCPDVWEMVFENYLCGICPSEYGMRCEEDDSTNGTDCSGYSSQCKTCWSKGVEGDE